MGEVKLTVVIPVYNEVSTIEEIVAKVKSSPVSNLEIILVDDFSTDGTRELYDKKLRAEVDQVILQPHNFGKGYAF